MTTKLSIIFGYRNRDSSRVKRCLLSLSNQTFQDFDVVFIDYGSDLFFSEEIKKVLSCFSFVKYYYSNTKGYPWNRSHALNTGVRLSKSEYILLGDIDLIYSPNSISALLEQASDRISVYSQIFFLDKSFNKWNDLSSINLSSFEYSDCNPIGAVYLVNKNLFEKIGGFDEFYCFWGVEDRDLFHRLKLSGVTEVFIDKEKYPIFHQWHPIVSNQTKGFFPEKWWDEMNIHYQLNWNNLKRNGDFWGKLIVSRPIDNAQTIHCIISQKYLKSYQKSQLICEIIDSLSKISSEECLQIEVDRISFSRITGIAIKYVNLFFRKISASVGIDYISNVEKEKITYPVNDIMFLVWRLIKVEDVILDYSIQENKDKMIIRLMTKQQ